MTGSARKQDDAEATVHVETRPVYAVLLLLAGILCAVGIGWLLGRAPTLPLSRLPHTALCAEIDTGIGLVYTTESRDSASCTTADVGVARHLDAIRSYAAESTELGMFVFLCLAALAGVAIAVAAAWDALREPTGARGALVAVYIIGLGVTAFHGWRIFTSSSSAGFLSRLLETLPDAGTCAAVSTRLKWVRGVGEVCGFVVGTAMAGTAAIAKATATTIADRIRWLQRLLYAASLLFVAGLLTSAANFAWVLSNWTGSSAEGVSKAIEEVVKSGTVQAGVGYSALIAVFFVPIRAYFEWLTTKLAGANARPSARKEILQSAGLDVSWWEDAKQILALLAPVLAAPVFDALVKSK